MNYDYFTQLEEGTLVKSEAETEQAFMERILSAVFTEKTEELKDRFNDRMNPQFYSCSAEQKSLSVSFTTEEWMLNPNGTLHGGLSGATVDMVMSILARFLVKRRTVVTVQLNTNYLRSVRRGEDFVVHVVADHVGRRCVMTHAYVTTEASDKPVITATGVLM